MKDLLNIEITKTAKKDAPIVVFHHRLCASLDLLDEQQFPDYRPLSENFNLIRFDPRGHGKSPGTTNPIDYTWSSLAKDLDGVLSRISPYFSDASKNQLFLLGSSMGSATIISYLTASAENRSYLDDYTLKGIILALPPSFWETRIVSFYNTLADKLRDSGLTEYVNYLRTLPQTPFFQREFPESKEISLKHTALMNPSYYEAMIRGAVLSDLPERSLVEKIALRTLILGRIEDRQHPISSCEVLKEIIADSELFIAKNKEDIFSYPDLITNFIGIS